MKLILFAILLVVIPTEVLSATGGDDAVWKAYDAFNAAFLDDAKYIYKNTNKDEHAVMRDRGAAAIWCQPMYVDMALNAMELAMKKGDVERERRYRRFVDRLIEGNMTQYLGFNFDDNDLSRG